MVHNLDTIRIFRVYCGRQGLAKQFVSLGFVVIDRLEPVRIFGVCCCLQARTRSYLWRLLWSTRSSNQFVSMGFVVVDRVEPVRMFGGLLWSTGSNSFVSMGFVVVSTSSK